MEKEEQVVAYSATGQTNIISGYDSEKSKHGVPQTATVMHQKQVIEGPELASICLSCLANQYLTQNRLGGLTVNLKVNLRPETDILQAAGQPVAGAEVVQR